jgi:hypothetical protein
MRSIPSRSKSIGSKFTLIASLVALGTCGANAAVVYREVFGTSTGGDTGTDQLISTVNWSLYSGSTAVETGSSISTGGVSKADGRPINLPNIGQAQTEASQEFGLAFSGNTGSGDSSFAFTSEYNGTTALNKTSLEYISFYQGDGFTGDAVPTFRVALQIGGGRGMSAPASPESQSTAPVPSLQTRCN